MRKIISKWLPIFTIKYVDDFISFRPIETFNVKIDYYDNFVILIDLYQMSFIEGIGDDFLYAFGFLLFIGIVSLAWLSTHVNHIHFPATLFIIERRTRLRNGNIYIFLLK
jgi:predicted CDP-diglyceride synthetase/phosphatidate cytidylyltransferase